VTRNATHLERRDDGADAGHDGVVLGAAALGDGHHHHLHRRHGRRQHQALVV